MKIIDCKSEVLDNTPVGSIATLVAMPMHNDYEMSINTAKGWFTARLKSKIDYHLGGSHIFAVSVRINFDNGQQELILADFSRLMQEAIKERNKLISDKNGVNNPTLYHPLLTEAELAALFLKHLAYELS